MRGRGWRHGGGEDNLNNEKNLRDGGQGVNIWDYYYCCSFWREEERWRRWAINWWNGKRREKYNHITWREWKAKRLQYFTWVFAFFEFKVLKVLPSEMDETEETVWEECFPPSLNRWKMRNLWSISFHIFYTILLIVIEVIFVLLTFFKITSKENRKASIIDVLYIRKKVLCMTFCVCWFGDISHCPCFTGQKPFGLKSVNKLYCINKQ